MTLNECSINQHRPVTEKESVGDATGLGLLVAHVANVLKLSETMIRSKSL